jgi:hypothetical protein
MQLIRGSNGFPLLRSSLDDDMLGGSVSILVSFIVGCDEGLNEGSNEVTIEGN